MSRVALLRIWPDATACWIIGIVAQQVRMFCAAHEIGGIVVTDAGAGALKVSATPVVSAGNPAGGEELELMVMTFDRSGRARACCLAR